MFFGAATAGLLADKFGRKPVFQLSMVFWGAGSLMCGLSHTVDELMRYRVLLGFGMGMEFPIGLVSRHRSSVGLRWPSKRIAALHRLPIRSVWAARCALRCAPMAARSLRHLIGDATLALVSEIVPAKSRGRYVAILEGFWPLGFIAAGVGAYLCLPSIGWRGIFIALAVPAVFVFVVRRFVPESPRWLEDAGRFSEADAVTSGFEQRVLLASGRQMLAPVSTASGHRAPPAPRRVPFAELWQGVYARRTVMLWALWLFALLGYYGLTTWLGALLQQAGYEVAKSVRYTVLISLAGIPGFIFSAWLLEAWGRKPTCVLMLAGSAIAAYCYGQAAASHAPVAQLIIAGLCMQFFLFGMWSVLYAYTPELYPTRSRATGAGFASSVGRVGSLAGPYLVGLLLPVAGQAGIFTLGAASFVVAAGVVALLGVETKGQSLEELSH
ncbi:MFS transporter [Verminephrobacter eiseniae]|nr:MFS transporter [Verminephrobacter eiseniae]MCW5301914.1 MFS transporter [Verminephrobacter eiseniae]